MEIRSHLDLSKIYRTPIFQTRSARDAQYELSRQLIDHGLRWFPGEVCASLHRRELGRISLMILQYGTEVEVSPLAFDGFTLVQMPLKGSVHIESGGNSVRVNPGDVAVVTSGSSVRFLWEPGCEQLILRVPDSLLPSISDGAHGMVAASPVRWTDTLYKFRTELLDPWMGIVQQAVRLLPVGTSPILNPSWLEQFEQTLAGFVHAHQPGLLNSNDVSDDVPCTQMGPGQSSQLDRLEAYIRSRLFAPLALVDLARAAGVTTRTLNDICHRHRGVAPMTLVRNLRLDAARQRLLSGLPVSITDVALEHGFGHLGRFSSYYRERFGELPKHTGRVLKEARCTG